MTEQPQPKYVVMATRTIYQILRLTTTGLYVEFAQAGAAADAEKIARVLNEYEANRATVAQREDGAR